MYAVDHLRLMVDHTLLDALDLDHHPLIVLLGRGRHGAAVWEERCAVVGRHRTPFLRWDRNRALLPYKMRIRDVAGALLHDFSLEPKCPVVPTGI